MDIAAHLDLALELADAADEITMSRFRAVDLQVVRKDFYQEQGIELRLETRAEKLDPSSKTVQLSNGSKLSYGALLLATGASAIVPTLPGSDLSHVRTLRTLADSRSIIERSAGAKRAVLIGAGFIGLEVAASLRARGLEVTVVAPEALPLGRVLGEALGRAVQGLHEAHGVRFRLGARASAIGAQTVTLEDGSELEADLVVIGIGVRPNIELAEAAGLALDHGVVVDQYLRTSAPAVFAAGDIARFPDARTGDQIRVEHWVVATRQGETAALNMLGKGIDLVVDGIARPARIAKADGDGLKQPKLICRY